MPIATTIDRMLGIIFTTAGPMITDRDWRRHNANLRDHADFNPDFDQRLDFRRAEDCRLTLEVIRITAVQPIFGPNSRQAFVAANNLIYGMCRMYRFPRASPGS